VSLERLRRLADDFQSVPMGEFDALAEDCRDLAVTHLDVRFVVVGECLRLCAALPGPGEAGAVSTDFAEALARVWTAFLPCVLTHPSEETATALALSLRDELMVLAGQSPLTYEGP
jgi:hypothetical protein